MLEKLNNIYIGLVINNKDPKGRGRVQVFIPNITNTLYKNWNENTKDIKFRTLDSDIFNPEITQRLIDVLPWSEVTMPFFGGGTGAPVNTQTNEPTPVPTDPVVSSPGEYMVGSGSAGIQIPKRNLSSNGTVDVNRLSPAIQQKMANFVAAFPNAVITSGAEGKAGDGIHGKNSAHYVENNSDGYGHAIDLRIRDVDAATQQRYVEWLAQNGFKGIGWEGDHIHAQDTSTGGGNFTFGPTGSKASLYQTPSWFQNFSNNFTKGTYAASSSATPTTAAQTGAMPEKNGINNTSATVSNESSGTLKLAADRQAKFSEELKNPETMKALAFLAKYEVGDDPIDQQAWMETVVNRAQFRGKSLSFELIDNVRYWGGWGGDYRASAEYKKFSEKDSPEFKSTLNKVINGSNLTNLATDNASNEPGNRLADNRIRSGVTGSWMKNGIVVPAGTKEAEFLYRDKPFEKGASEYAKENGIIADSGQTPQPQKLNMICSSFNNNNVGSGMSSIGSAGGPIGMFSIPQVGAKAYVMFLDGNPLQPIVLGSFQDPSNVG